MVRATCIRQQQTTLYHAVNYSLINPNNYLGTYVPNLFRVRELGHGSYYWCKLKIFTNHCAVLDFSTSNIFLARNIKIMNLEMSQSVFIHSSGSLL